MRFIHILVLFALGVSSVYAGSAGTVPEKYHGLWDEPERCAAVLSVGVPDMGALVSANKIHRYEQYCTVTDVITEKNNLIDLLLDCMQEGEQFQSTIQLVLESPEQLSINQGDYSVGPLVRCE